MGVFAGPTNSWINLNSSNSLNGLVRNGLVLALDAGRTLSYPGSGTTWTDLSGSGNNGTLTNGPTYSSANGGSLVFDGVDDYVNLGSSIQNYSTFTTSFWVYYNSYDQRESPLGNASQPSGYHFLFLFGSIYVGFSSGYTGDPFIGVSLHPYKANPYIPTDPGDFYYNTWNNFVVTKDSNNDVLFYRNAVSLGGGNKPGVTNIDKIGLGLYFNDMRFPQLLFYNRALTATEVSQNFNATRSRFSI